MCVSDTCDMIYWGSMTTKFSTSGYSTFTRNNWRQGEMFVKPFFTTHQTTHMEVSFSVIAFEAKILSLTDSESHFVHSSSSCVHIFIEISGLLLQLLHSLDKMQESLRSRYCYPKEKSPLLALTWMSASRPPEFQQKLFKQSCSRAHQGQMLTSAHRHGRNGNDLKDVIQNECVDLFSSLVTRKTWFWGLRKCHPQARRPLMW